MGTTLIFFDTTLMGTDYDVVAALARVKSLFCPPGGNGGPPGYANVAVGSAACPLLISALNACGLPVPAAYYNEQYNVSAWSGALLATSVNASRVGSWNRVDASEVIALNLAFSAYATNQQFYKEAFAAGLAAALNITTNAVLVNDFQVSNTGGTLIYFDRVLYGSDYDVAAAFSLVQALFAQPCNIGSAATAATLAGFHRYGLPITAAYYNQDMSGIPAIYPSPPPGGVSG